MRTGLIVVGIGVAIIGAGVITSMVFLPTSQSVSQNWPVTALDIPSNQSQERAFPVSTPAGSSEQFELDWVATGTVAVSVYNATACNSASGACPIGHLAAVNWLSSTSGKWVAPNPLPQYYEVVIWNVGPVPVNFTGHAVETYSAPWGQLPSWATISIVLGGVVLLGIGGMALFLGFFLRPAVFRPSTRYPPVEPYELGEDEPVDRPPLVRRP